MISGAKILLLAEFLTGVLVLSLGAYLGMGIPFFWMAFSVWLFIPFTFGWFWRDEIIDLNTRSFVGWLILVAALLPAMVPIRSAFLGKTEISWEQIASMPLVLAYVYLPFYIGYALQNRALRRKD